MPQRYVHNHGKLYSNYHLLLAQELYVLEDEIKTAMLKFWNTSQQYGHFIILDNGAYELKAAMDDTKYSQVIAQLRPNEVILPDVLFNSKESMARAENFYHTHGFLFSEESAKAHNRHKINGIAVIQAETRQNATIDFNEIEKQLHFYHTKLHVKTICIPKHFGHDRPYGRVDFTEQLHQFFTRNPQWLDIFNVHYLGLACIVELAELPKYPWIRGIDTAAAFVYAYHKMALADYQDTVSGKDCSRPANFFELKDLPYGTRFLNNNIRTCIRMLAYGNTRTRYADR